MSAPTWWHRPIADGDKGRDVAIVQRKLGLLPTGDADPVLAITLRGFQKGVGVPQTGVVDEPTAVALGEQEGFGLLPAWWDGPVYPESDQYLHALRLLGATDVAGVKRFQGNHHIPPTGVIDETTARLLAGLEVDW